MMILQILANGVCLSAVYVLLAIGFGLIYFTTKTFHIAYGALYTIGAYVGFFAVVTMALPRWAGAFLAVVSTGLAGVLLERFLHRPLAARRSQPEIVMIASLGVYIAAANGIAIIAGSQTRLLQSGVAQTLDLGVVALTKVQVTQLLTGTAIAVGLAALLRVHRQGQDLRAIADNSVLAEVVGIDVAATRCLAFGTGAGLAGLAGYLRALDVGVDPNVGFNAVLVAAVCCVVGGLGIYTAPIAGALLLGLAQSLGGWFGSSRWEHATTFILLVAVLVIRPEGIFGTRKRLEET